MTMICCEVRWAQTGRQRWRRPGDGGAGEGGRRGQAKKRAAEKGQGGGYISGRLRAGVWWQLSKVPDPGQAAESRLPRSCWGRVLESMPWATASRASSCPSSACPDPPALRAHRSEDGPACPGTPSRSLCIFTARAPPPPFRVRPRLPGDHALTSPRILSRS